MFSIRGIFVNVADLIRKAELGSVAAQSILGACYLDGIDVEVNYPEAFRLLSAAAKSGASRAIANLARMHAEGLGIERDVIEAIRLFETAAASGEFSAHIDLARIYSREDKGIHNPQEALKWYAAAAAQESNVDECEELREAKAYVAAARDRM